MLDSENRHHGLSKREQEIMDLHDAGVSQKIIADELGLQRQYVRQIIQLYDFPSVWNAGNKFDAMVAQGSQALARAIERTGKRFT